MTKIYYTNDVKSIYDYRFLEALAEKYDVYLVTFDEPDRVPPGVKVVRLRDLPLRIKSFHKMELVLKTPLRLILLRLFLRKLKPDLLDGCYIPIYGFYSAVTGVRPLLLTAWGSDILVLPKNPILRILIKFTLRRADGVIVDSEVQRKAVMELGYDGKKIWSFPWGIELDRFKPEVDSSGVGFSLGWNGNPVVISTRWHKPIYGVEYLLKAIPLVVKDHPEARFLIAGEGPLTGSFKRMVRDYGVEDYVKFVGKIPPEKMPNYLNASSIFVSTSLSDGTSASLLEAMACGLPVIVTDILGNREWVEDGKNGYLTPVRDSQALADRIKMLLKNEEIRRSMKENNLRLVKERADWKRNVKVFYDAIETLLKQHGRTGNQEG